MELKLRWDVCDQVSGDLKDIEMLLRDASLTSRLTVCEEMETKLAGPDSSKCGIFTGIIRLHGIK